MNACGQITYDPRVITYRELLEVFFTIHDPTTKNRCVGWVVGGGCVSLTMSDHFISSPNTT